MLHNHGLTKASDFDTDVLCRPEHEKRRAQGHQQSEYNSHTGSARAYLFFKVFGRKDLSDLNGVAFVRWATLRPLDHFLLGRRFHQPVTAHHFFRFDERSVGHGGPAFWARPACTHTLPTQTVMLFNL